MVALLGACSTPGGQPQAESEPPAHAYDRFGAFHHRSARGACESAAKREEIVVDLQDPDPDLWELYLTVGYGDAQNELGLSRGGDGEGLRFGPDFAAVDAAGAVWVVDTANARVVVLTPQGTLHDEFALPPQFGGQFPVLLDDGTFVLSSGLNGLLIKREGAEPVVIPTKHPAFWRRAVGSTLFGTRLVGRTAESALTRLEVDVDGYLVTESVPGPIADDVAWSVTLYGEGSPPSMLGAFSVVTDCVTRVFEVNISDPTALPAVEYAVDNYGSLHALAYASVGSDGTFVSRGNYLRMDPTGSVCITAIPPFGPGIPPNPGSPSRLQLEGTTAAVYAVDVSDEGLTVWTAAQSCASTPPASVGENG